MAFGAFNTVRYNWGPWNDDTSLTLDYTRNATLAQTQTTQTFSAAGVVSVVADLIKTLIDDALASYADLVVGGTLTQTQDDQWLASRARSGHTRGFNLNAHSYDVTLSAHTEKGKVAV